jgi:adenylate cyclase
LLYLFEDFALDTDRRELRRGGAMISIEPKAFDLLAYVIENRARVVSKDDLIARVWDGRIVSDSAMTTRLNAARSAIADSGEEQRLIKTLPRKGIRFVGVVREPGEVLQSTAAEPVALAPPALILPDKPSIAVLPFTNMSGDAQQDYFADGITDDIITELSRFSELFVIARNSSFQYRGKAVDVRHIGRELGVRYVLEGSIRRGGDRVRIGAQLVDALTGIQRWAERYDRKLEDVFAIQDEVVCSIAPVLAAHINKAEVERAFLKPPSTWRAHDFYLRGSETLHAYLSSYDARDLHEARRHLELALSTDPNYGRAYANLSYTHFTAWINSVDADFLKPETLERAYQLARRAVQLEPTLPPAHAQLGIVLTFKGLHDEAVAEVERALALHSNFNDRRFASTLLYAGFPARAMETTNALIRLDPYYPPLTSAYGGYASYTLKQYEAAVSKLREACGRAPRQRNFRQWLAASYAQLGELNRAGEEAAAVLQIQPDYSIKRVAATFSPFKRPEDAEHLFQGLRKAGLPER